MNRGRANQRRRKTTISSTPQRLLPEAAAEALERIREDRERVEEDRIKSMLAYIEEHLFDRDLNVNSLKHHCGIRDGSIPVRFTSALGITPHAYIEDRRMETAGRLLVDTALKVWQIAKLVGYSGIQVFSRAFERWFRVRPAVYRREQRKWLPAPAAGPAAQKAAAPLPEPMLREIPITRIWHELPFLPDQLAAQPGAVAVSRRGEPVLVVISWELFESLLEIIEDEQPPLEMGMARRRDDSPPHSDGDLAMNLATPTKSSKKPGKSNAFQHLLPAAAAATLQRIHEDRGRVEDPFKSMLAHVEEHLFDGDLNVDSLLHHYGIRNDAGTTGFTAALGVSPGVYVEDRRMETAGRLLVDTELRVWQIGELVGYSSFQVFSRAFARWFGVRPTVYRREERQRLPAPPADPAAQKPGTPLPEPMLREIPITEMWHQVSSLPDQLAAQPGAVAVTREGEPVLAVISWELFESLLEILED